MKEAEDIQKKIMGEKEAKMKKDWYSPQIPQTNCSNCVDLGQYFVLMETYMEKFVMFLISERNVVITYEYK